VKTADFDYILPPELIAQRPTAARTASRLLRYRRADKSITDGHFPDIIDALRPDDVLVRNTTRVIPARLLGKRSDTGGAMELLLLKRIEGDEWEVLAKPARRATIGRVFSFGGELSAEVLGELPLHGGRRVRLIYSGVFEEVLNRAGSLPLPPYIRESLPESERERYQTVYAKERGSAAAPTAGLHFDEDTLRKIQEKGVAIADILLHVGLGTFRPVEAEDLRDHKMHAEWYEISEQAAATINGAAHSGGRVVCVGTTSLRALESAADADGIVRAGSAETDIFITPGYIFRRADALLTNFHLPKSTLLMLISAFAGREEMLRVYAHAVEQRYRFFSFGDAMLIE